MAADKNRKLIFGGVGAVVVLVIAVLLGKSLFSYSGAQPPLPNATVVRDTASDFDEAKDSVATRTSPTEGRSRSGRLADSSEKASVDEEDPNDEGSVGKKTKRDKKRRSRRQRSEEESEEEEDAKKGGKAKLITKPF